MGIMHNPINYVMLRMSPSDQNNCRTLQSSDGDNKIIRDISCRTAYSIPYRDELLFCGGIEAGLGVPVKRQGAAQPYSCHTSYRTSCHTSTTLAPRARWGAWGGVGHNAQHTPHANSTQPPPDPAPHTTTSTPSLARGQPIGAPTAVAVEQIQYTWETHTWGDTRGDFIGRGGRGDAPCRGRGRRFEACGSKAME